MAKKTAVDSVEKKQVDIADEKQPASLRDEFKRLTRERLIKAATELFEKQGFRATTVQQIAKRAGTTHTTFYQHFRSKADLVRLFRDEVSAEIRATMVAFDNETAPTWQDIRAWVDEYAQMWRRTHVRCEALWDAMGAEPEIAADVIPDGYELTATLTRLLERYPVAQRPRVQNKLMLLLLLMDRLCFLLHSQEKKSPSATLQDDMADLIWLALQAPASEAKAVGAKIKKAPPVLRKK
ncbi:MAG: transcriptional regulator, TetR family [Verrucomicrobiaceae bacterium]|nr:transcriptional regulator, TetR family [Verrucomicrobiaceae bacterium]